MSKYVKEVGVIAVKGVPYDTPYAFAVLKDDYVGADVTPKMIIDEIQSGLYSLNDPEMVEELFIVESLPYLSSGKIDYRALEKRVSRAKR